MVRSIDIKGARLHNLKNIDLSIPHRQLTVVTGLSGSGKSTLVFDTLYAEGQRRYIESLSAYARQFLGKIDKPEVDHIHGIAPAIAISQKVRSSNPRSTVGTTTEVYDYLKLLFARIGRTYSPISGHEVRRHTAETITAWLMALPDGTRLSLLAPIGTFAKDEVPKRLELLMHQGFVRVRINGATVRIEQATELQLTATGNTIDVVTDRLVIKAGDNELGTRLPDAVRTALSEGRNRCMAIISSGEKEETLSFSSDFEADGIRFEEPSVHLFSFNNPYGACKRCEGFGSIIGIDPELVVPDRSKSIFEEAIVCWKGESMGKWREDLVRVAHKFDFPVHRPFYDLTDEQVRLVWNGNQHFQGLHAFFRMLEENSYKIQYRVMLSRYRGKTTCPECNGTRLRNDANNVRVCGRSISDLVLMPVDELADFFSSIELNEEERQVSKRILLEINSRLRFLLDVGLGYLTLNRLSSTLSGGESQRIHLASSLGSSLVGSMYILDEPSIGLHPRDTARLIGILKRLRDLGNTVIVVEHDEDIMRSADMIVDIGPEAGTNGGNVVFRGDLKALDKADTLTGRYLRNEERIDVPASRRPGNGQLVVVGARENNLKGLNVRFPLNCLAVVTGVSGSGKSTLIKDILYPAVARHLAGYGQRVGQFERLDGDLDRIKHVEFVDQDPIGRSSRSNPVTFIKAYDEIRDLFAELPISKLNGFKPKHFSFNVEGGRCDVCEGEGSVKIEMQFMADIVMKCENCNGQRFKAEVLEARFHNLSISDILRLTVDEAMDFFGQHAPKVEERLRPLQDVGLGYVKLGQSSSTLSGGEAQRIKLASFLGKGKGDQHVLFIFDEPTTGLHFHDIHKLLRSFDALIKAGHSVVLIEHHPDVIKCADHVIDLGPEGGKGGGTLLFEGTPEGLVKCKESHTGRALQGKLA
jgi:excinuclease ABC subunit A